MHVCSTHAAALNARLLCRDSTSPYPLSPGACILASEVIALLWIPTRNKRNKMKKVKISTGCNCFTFGLLRICLDGREARAPWRFQEISFRPISTRMSILLHMSQTGFGTCNIYNMDRTFDYRLIFGIGITPLSTH